MTRSAIVFGVVCFVLGLTIGILATLYLSPSTPAQQDARAQLIVAQAKKLEAEAEQMRVDAKAEEVALQSVATVKVVSAWVNLFAVPGGVGFICLVVALWFRRSATESQVVQPIGQLPVTNFAKEQPATKNFVYVHGGGTQKVDRDLQDVREFLERGAVAGFARADWVGRNITFKSGHTCTRTRYEQLRDVCLRANVLTEEGNTVALACPLAEALDCFSDGESDGPEWDGTGQAG